MKNYLCVKFEKDSTTDIVHKFWMQSKTSCQWPPVSSDVPKLAKEAAKPNLNWKLFKCEILCEASKSCCMPFQAIVYLKTFVTFPIKLKFISSITFKQIHFILATVFNISNGFNALGLKLSAACYATSDFS